MGVSVPGASIEVQDLVRVYGRGSRARTAVDGISFEVTPGQLFGILGPNGAGKTTTIKVLLTTLLPTSGTVRVAGHDVVRDTTAVRRKLGAVLGGDKGFFDRLMARSNLAYFADLYEVPHRTQRTRIPELVELVGLSGRADERVETYSRGMRQRLHIARSLLHDPSVLVLDEPTNGIDPVGARESRELVARLSSRGTTILLTTHYMHEADTLCDQVVVMREGKLVASGAPRDIKRLAGTGRVVELELAGVSPMRIDLLRELPGVLALHVQALDQRQLVQVHTAADVDCVSLLVRHFGADDVRRVETREPSLEDAYVSLVSSAAAP